MTNYIPLASATVDAIRQALHTDTSCVLTGPRGGTRFIVTATRVGYGIHQRVRVQIGTPSKHALAHPTMIAPGKIAHGTGDTEGHALREAMIPARMYWPELATIN